MKKNCFSDNLKLLMKRKRMSQEDLAELLSKGRSAVGSYIRGETEPSIEALIQMTEIFGVSLDHLIFTDISNKGYSENIITHKVADKNEHFNEKAELLKSLFQGDNREVEKKIDDLAAVMAKFHFELNDMKKEIKKIKVSDR